MRFEDLASAVHAAQTEPKNASHLTVLFKRHADSAHDIVTLCCASPRGSIKPHHVVKMLAQSYGLFPEEYESLMDEHEMPALLASESPREVNESISVREAIEFKEMILRGEINADILFKSMSQLSAMVFWGFAFGKSVINHRRIMQAVASLTPYDTKHLQQMRAIMPTGDVIQRAMNETLPHDFIIQPAYPFMAPHYSRWNKWSVPFTNTHYDIIKGKRYYAHRRGDSVFRYDSAARMVVAGPMCAERLPEEDCVCEMDGENNIIEWLYREDAPDLWTKGRELRATNPKRVEDRAHLRALVQSLGRDEVLRLVDADRPYFHSGCVGGFVVPRRTFDIPLLILGGFRDGEGIRIKVAALDGFDLFPVGYAYVKADDIPDRLARLYDAQVMLDVDEGLVGIFHSLGYEHETKTLRAPYLTRLDTTLGQSDAIQIGDLIERGGTNG